MGSKNRIYLGILVSLILHHHRNSFNKKVYMTKRVEAKIRVKHIDSFVYANKIGFIQLQENTIAYLEYDGKTEIVNFIAYVKNSFILYGLKKEKHHTSCNTIFKLRASTLKKYYKNNSFKLMKNEYEKIIEEYIN